MGAARVGRNQLCPCGSGRKYKQCHATKDERMSVAMWVALAGVAGVIVAGLILGATSFHTDMGPGAGRVWSEEHGHYH